MSKLPRLRNILVVPDVHVPYHDEAAVKLLLEVAEDLELEHTIVLGDLIDCDLISRFLSDPRLRVPTQEEADQAQPILDRLRGVTRDRCIYTLGNHEDRIRREAWHAPDHSIVKGIEEIFDLDGWELVDYGEGVDIGKIYYTHDLGKGTGGKYGAQRSQEAIQGSVVSAHSHRLDVNFSSTAKSEPRVSVKAGWLGDPSKVTYQHRAVARRECISGFVIGHLDTQTGDTFFEPAPIVDGRVFIAGKLYKQRRN